MRALVSALALGIVFASSACSPSEKPAETPAAAPAPAPAAEAPPPAPAAAPADTSAAAPDAAPPAAGAPATAPQVEVKTIDLDVKDAAGAKMAGDTGRGKSVFNKCATCHSAAKGTNRTGPSLYGIVGRPAGTAPGFRYTDANRKSGITWTQQEMFNYLEAPQKRIPGTAMTFVGLKKPQDRADVIAYLTAVGQQ